MFPRGSLVVKLRSFRNAMSVVAAVASLVRHMVSHHFATGMVAPSPTIVFRSTHPTSGAKSCFHVLFPRLAVHSYGTPQETSYSLEQSAAADDDANDDANDDNGCWTNDDRHEKRTKDC